MIRAGAAAGFTLVELLVAMVLVSILGLGAINVFVSQHQAFIDQNEGVRIEENARAGFEMLVREVRNAGFDPRGTAAAGIDIWRDDSLSWTADLNADGDLDDDGEDVLYFHDSDAGALVREEPGLTATIADHVTNLQFAYLQDAAGTTATGPDEIELIAITYEYDMPEGNLQGRLETRVAVRNAMYDE